MAKQQRVGEHADEQAGSSTVIKRRGILAAAGAVVAGIVANQAAQPVAASASMQFANTTTTVENTASGQTVIIDSVGYTGTDAVFCGQILYGNAKCGIQGVSGLRGVPPFRCGVYGDVGTSNSVGVFGNANSGAPSIGVFGRSESTGIGVQGQSLSGTGVMGQTTDTGIYGVYGQSAAAGGVGVGGTVTGGYGVLGTVSDGYGVLGQADTGNGLYGFSQQNHAVVGQTAQPYFGGVFGVATIANTVGIYGSTKSGRSNVTSAYAGYMDGNFVVANGFKSAAVAHADGTHRLVYCLESPESWFEDFGKAKLVGGKAEVILDPDFAALVHADDYHVFLTAYGNTNGLHVPHQSATGFSVQEHNGGRGSLTFSWRVVAKRKDITPARLAKFDLVGKEQHDTTPPHAPPAPPMSQVRGGRGSAAGIVSPAARTEKTP